MALSLAGATLGAGIISGLSSAFGAYKSGQDAKEATQKQIAWERERATHAHQWEVADLKAAGLNPILSAGGNGATTGGISAPMPDRSGYTGAIGAVMDAITSAYGASLTHAQIGKTGAETNNIVQETENKITARELMQKQIINESLRSGLISAQKANLEFKNLTEKYQGERAKLTYWNHFLNEASSTAKNVGDIVGVKNMINKLLPQKQRREVEHYWKEIGSPTMLK